jgi:oligogalacturonide lyase
MYVYRILAYSIASSIASCILTLMFAQSAGAQIPDEFVDPQTHLRVVHLSRFPNDRSGVIYFTYPSFTQDSRFALIDEQFDDKWRHLYSFDFSNLTVKPLVTDRLTQDQVVAAKTGHLYYLADNAAWVISLTGGAPRKIADLPAKWCPGAGFSVSADESLLVGASTDDDRPPSPKPAADPTSNFPIGGVETFAQHRPNVLFTINIQTGALKVVHRVNTWLGHVQFSPTDPELVMFCHEGPWEKVDRIWLLHLDQTDPYILYHRTEPKEIVGHEFWAPDGKSIWFQQTFRDLKKDYLTGKDLQTGKLTQYTIPATGNSIHFTWSPDGTFLIGDGSGKGKDTANRYLSALIPENGKLRLVHLCSLLKNDYSIEPNPHVSPDNHWVIFTATLFGTPQAYAVEVPPGTLFPVPADKK